MGLTSKAFSDIITFSRSSNATRVGPDGKIAYAPHNLLTYSAQFDNAAWTKENVSITANAIAAPDGTVTADKIIPDTVNIQHRTYQVASVAGASGTHSVYAKAGEYSIVAVRESNTTGNYAVFNLATGTIFAGYTASSPTITAVGNGWYRLTINIPNTTTQALGVNVVSPSYTSGSPTASWVADGTSGLYIWGAQLSVGSIAGDYTATTSAAVYGPRFDYDPVTLAAKGLLIEEQRTNLLTYSEDLSNAAWTATAATVSANAATAPDGTSTADILTDNVSSDTHRVYQISTTTAAAYTASVFAKAGTRSWIYIRIQDSGGAGRHVWFNLATGTVGTTETGMTAAIQAAGNGWYRCAATVATAIAGATNQVVVIGMSTGDAVSTYAGGSGTVSLWGAQLEAGAFATSYIPTVASTVTRSADVASVNTLSPWFNAVEGTIFAQFDRIANVTSGLSSGFPRTVEFNDTTANERIAVLGKSSTYESMIVSDGGAEQANIDGGSTVSGNVVAKIAATYKVNDFAISLNGGAVATDTSGTLPTVTRMDLGYSNASGGYYINGHLRRIAYYPRRLTNAELQALTA